MNLQNAPPDPKAASADDEALARRARAGCTASFEELARRYQVPLVHFLGRWASREDAEDLVQDTLLRAYRNLHRFRPGGSFAAWLFTIARRLSINHQRRRRPARECKALEQIEQKGPEPGEVVAGEESRQRLWDVAAGALSEPQMTATWLYYVEEMSVGQIARVLRCSQAAAKVTLFRARKRLLPVLESLEARGSKEDRRAADGACGRPIAE